MAKTKYKEYVAIISQSGINHPVASELSNDIGNITLTRLELGRYQIHSNNAFTIGKTIAPPFSVDQWVHLPVFYDNVASHYYSIHQIDSSNIQINIVDNTWTPVEWSSLQSDMPITVEIRVYQ